MNPIINNQTDYYTNRILCSVFSGLQELLWFASGCNLTRQQMLLCAHSSWKFNEELNTVDPVLLNLRVVIQFQDSAKPHIAKITCDTIIELSCETWVRPQYLPNITLSDYHLSHFLQNHLRGGWFQKLYKVIHTVDDVLVHVPLNFITLESIPADVTISDFPITSYFMLSPISW